MECKRDGDTIRLSFEVEESSVLDRLLAEMTSFIGEGTDRSDPITDRLFPAAYEDPEEQATYEELIGDQLRAIKTESFGKVRKALKSREGQTVVVDRADVDPWLATLTDLRLALGARLEVTEEAMSRELDPDDPDAPALSVLHWLGWVQESILKELMADTTSEGGPSAAEG